MQNHYRTLGITNAASAAEIRRAYRVLARRYHPDVNPDGDGGELFKSIALAYAVLSDPEKKQQYDLDLKQSQESFSETFERAQEALRRNQRAAAYARQQHAASARQDARQPNSARTGVHAKPTPVARKDQRASALLKLAKSPRQAARALRDNLKKLRSRERRRPASVAGTLTILELSVSIEDAIRGTRRTVEIATEATSTRKVSVTIPPGVRTGSIIRLRSKDRPNEEIVLMITLEQHPWLSVAERGLTMEIPLTVAEAIDGTKIQVPSLGDPLLVKVEPLTQSGKEVRLKNQGILAKDGTRGDLYIRFIVKIPCQPLPTEIRSLTELMSEAYTVPVRQHLPARILGEDVR